MSELIYSWETERGWKHKRVSYMEAFKVKAPICPRCKEKVLPDVASFADRYEPAAAYDDPSATVPTWSGEFWCNKCNKMIGCVHHRTGREKAEDFVEGAAEGSQATDRREVR